MSEAFDAVIVGGGPVGAAAALELNSAGLSVLLIEAREAVTLPLDATSGYRPLALSYGSRLILERLGVWDGLVATTPIERIHISHRGRFGRTVLTAREAKLHALGYVLDYVSLLSALENAIADAQLHTQVRVVRGARVTTLAHGRTSARIEFETATGTADCLGSVVIVADGTAETLGIAVRVMDYGQTALSARVETDIDHAFTAYERFTPEGPLALLPCGKGYGLVWTLAPGDAERLCVAAPGEFLSELQARFGERAGRFTAVSARATHPHAMRIAEHTTWGRAVLVGNSAQGLHPVAGQGFNLGLRDAWELAGEIRKLRPNHERLLESYRARRRIDRTGGIAFTHALVQIFSNDWLPLALARGAGLSLLDSLPAAKDFVVRRMVFGARG